MKRDCFNKPIEIRKEFPETWIWESLDLSSDSSDVVLHKKVPDTMTSWIITGFSIDPYFGLGLTKQASKLTVFQPFFVTTNLPSSIKRGEVVSIPLLVFNYMETDLEAEVTLFNDDNEFEFVDVHEETGGRRRRNSGDHQGIRRIQTKSQIGTTVNFMIRPLKAGNIKIKATVSCDIAGDGLERQLIVKPEGITHYKNEAVFVDLRDDQEFSKAIDIEIPSNYVAGSVRIEASAIGDVLGTTIDNLDKLM
jgi:CD109 antigen